MQAASMLTLGAATAPGRCPTMRTAVLVFGLFLSLSSLCPLCLFGEKPPAVLRLTTDGGLKQHLQWSPDGSKFLFTRIHEGKMALWTMNADGSDLKPLLPPTTPLFDGHWSPDGKRIAYVHDTLQGTDGKLQI